MLTEPALRGSDYTLLEDGTTETITGDSPLRTYMDINIKPIDPDPRVPDEPIDIYGMHPWHHPGRAPNSVLQFARVIMIHFFSRKGRGCPDSCAIAAFWNPENGRERPTRWN